MVLAALAVLSACNRDREPILPGERLDVNAPLSDINDAAAAKVAAAGQDGAQAAAAAALASSDGVGLPEQDVSSGVNAVPVSLPGATANPEWTHRGGSVTHRVGNAAAGAAPVQIWSANVGRGDSRKNRIAADPVVGGGRVYALDADARLTAVSTAGSPAWTTDLAPQGEASDGASGGGVAYGGGRVFVTTGFGEILSVDAGTGAIQWRQRLEASAGGAPLVSGDTVYAAARDGTGWALNAANGKVLWRTSAAPGGAGTLGTAGPALDGTRVVYPFPSGQLVAVDAKTGATVWEGFVAGKRLGRAIASVGDLTGDPVVADGVIYTGSSAGRLSAMNAETGEAFWQAKDGPVSPVVLAGGAIWFVSDENQLVRLDAASGQTVWRVDLPFFTKDKIKRRQSVFVHYGPVLAGGRLWTASTDGYLRAFDPASGAVVYAVPLPGGGAASAPVVAGGTIYVVSRNGQLHAFR
jgi:outer membrane protein assembly factor BamB